VGITAGQRYELHNALVNAWGDDVANTLMEHLPPSGWSDVVRTSQLDEVERRLTTRIDHLDGRLKLMLSGGLAFALAIIAIQVQIVISVANL